MLLLLLLHCWMLRDCEEDDDARGELYVEREGDSILMESEICECYVLWNKWTCALQSHCFVSVW